MDKYVELWTKVLNYWTYAELQDKSAELLDKYAEFMHQIRQHMYSKQHYTTQKYMCSILFIHLKIILDITEIAVNCRNILSITYTTIKY